MLQSGPGIGKITTVSTHEPAPASGSGARLQRKGREAPLAKKSANKSFALQLPGALASGRLVFLLTATDPSSSAGISLEGSKDSRLFPDFSEVTDGQEQCRLPGGGAAQRSRRKPTPLPGM